VNLSLRKLAVWVLSGLVIWAFVAVVVLVNLWGLGVL
jgi:hypothetical protein